MLCKPLITFEELLFSVFYKCTYRIPFPKVPGCLPVLMWNGGTLYGFVVWMECVIIFEEIIPHIYPHSHILRASAYMSAELSLATQEKGRSQDACVALFGMFPLHLPGNGKVISRST